MVSYNKFSELCDEEVIGQLWVASKNSSTKTILFSYALKSTHIIDVIKSVLLRSGY